MSSDNNKNLELQELSAPEPSIEKASGDHDTPGDVAETLNLEAVYDIPVRVAAVIGKTQMQMGNLLNLKKGSVVTLDHHVGDLIDIYVNNRLVARGELVVTDTQLLGVTMTEIVKSSSSSL